MKLANTIRLIPLGALGALCCLGLAGCNDSNPVAVVQAPAVPTGVYTITGDGQVEVVWNPVRGNGVAGYGVYRSSTADGAYVRLATVMGVESTSYTDFDVANGATYFYAVDAFNSAGDESELSYENAFDTPRPAGQGVTVYAFQDDPARSGIDWSAWSGSGFVKAYDHPMTDLVVHRVNGLLFVRGTAIGGFWNDIQSLGWTESLDEISWAPQQGWSVNPDGVELVVGHSYVVWTHDNFFAKFRVVQIVESQQIPSAIVIDWAYQIDPGNPELSPGYVARGEFAGEDRRVS
jgi:hypothetical protein